MPIDSKVNRVARERKLVRNLVEQKGMEDLDNINKLQVTTTHNDVQADNSINDGTIFPYYCYLELHRVKLNSAMI